MKKPILIGLFTACTCVVPSLANPPASPPAIPKYNAHIPKPTHAEVPYGDHTRQVFDFWQAPSDRPTPLVLVIHGGGWVNGSKERIDRCVDVKTLLDAGISVAACNYRYIPIAAAEGISPPVKGPLTDAARVLQTLRARAKEWNLDPTRVGATGSSAGACTSLWLAYHDDLADPMSADPIARQSTRLTTAAVIEAQTTLDPQQAKEWMPNSVYGGHAFGKKSFAQALKERESILPWIAEYSPYALASSDDPPVILFYPRPPAMGQSQKDPTHSTNYGVGLAARCQELGIRCEIIHPGITQPRFTNATDYFIHELKKQPTKNKPSAVE